MKNTNVLVSVKNFMGNEFQGNANVKPEESPEDRWFCIVNNVMSPYENWTTTPNQSQPPDRVIRRMKALWAENGVVVLVFGRGSNEIEIINLGKLLNCKVIHHIPIKTST